MYTLGHSSENLKMDSKENFDRNRILQLFAFFVENLSLYTQSLIRQHNYVIRRLSENLQISDLFDTINDRLAGHPPLKFMLLASVLTCMIPVLMFIIFGVTSVIITFIGFLFMEGTLLALGVFCMFICILTMILAFSALGLALGMMYLLVLKVAHKLNNSEATSRIIRVLVPSINERHVEEMPNMIAGFHQD